MRNCKNQRQAVERYLRKGAKQARTVNNLSTALTGRNAVINRLKKEIVRLKAEIGRLNRELASSAGGSAATNTNK